jgi:hypothetical protein
MLLVPIMVQAGLVGAVALVSAVTLMAPQATAQLQVGGPVGGCSVSESSLHGLEWAACHCAALAAHKGKSDEWGSEHSVSDQKQFIDQQSSSGTALSVAPALNAAFGRAHHTCMHMPTL